MNITRKQWLIVGGIWAGAALIYFLLTKTIPAPIRFQDEFLYWGVAKDIANHGSATWRGVDIGLKTFFYPLFLAPAILIGKTVAIQYVLVHLLNSLVMTAIVFPVYWMLRNFTSHKWGILGALLSILIPSMYYVGIIETEALAYPFFLLSIVYIWHTINNASYKNFFILGVLIVISIMVRAQFVSLVPIYLVSLFSCVMIQNRKKLIKEHITPVIILGIFFAVFTGVLLFFPQFAGIYKGVGAGINPNLGIIFYWLRNFLADIVVIAGIIPFIFWLGLYFKKSNYLNKKIGSYLIISMISSLAIIFQAIIFQATSYQGWELNHILYDRYVFYLAPLFIIGFILASSNSKIITKKSITISGSLTILFMLLADGHNWYKYSYDFFTAGAYNYVYKLFSHNPDNMFMLLGILTLSLLIICVITYNKSNVIKYIPVLLTFLILIFGSSYLWIYGYRFHNDLNSVYVENNNSLPKSLKNKSIGIINGPMNTYGAQKQFAFEFWNPEVKKEYTNFDVLGNVVGVGSCNLKINWYGYLNSKCGMVDAFLYTGYNPIISFKNEIIKNNIIVPEKPVKIDYVISGINPNHTFKNIKIIYYPNTKQEKLKLLLTSNTQTNFKINNQTKILNKDKLIIINPNKLGKSITNISSNKEIHMSIKK